MPRWPPSIFGPPRFTATGTTPSGHDSPQTDAVVRAQALKSPTLPLKIGALVSYLIAHVVAIRTDNGYGSHRSGATLSWVARFIYILFTGPPEIPRPAPSRQFFASSIREHEFSPTGSLRGRNHPPDRSARGYGTEMAADLYQRRTLRMSLATCYRQQYLPLRTSDTPDIFYRNTSSLSEPKICTLGSCTYHVVGLPEVCSALQPLSIRKTGTGPPRATTGMLLSTHHMSKSNSSGASAALWSPRKQLSAG